ncbi:unnamed protein product [Rhizoctonia solani]|uniref:Transmembrane protein n=1 Tax=Rhizoctonia solani TaxID=456999 RepID=A0A8H2XNN4_9AGAM|nr:unnamed protein product [Rhizoctonia solani]
MQTFARLLSFVAFLLSVGFLAQALPTAAAGNGIAVRDYSSPAGYSGAGNNGNSGSPSSSSYSKESSPSFKDDDKSNSIDILPLVLKLGKDIKPVCAELEAAADITVAVALVDKIVIIIKAFVAILVNVKLNLSLDVKTKIAVEIVACISVILKALAAVCAKLGVDVCIALIAKIDVCFQLLLITLNLCVDGLLAIIISLILKIDGTVLAVIKNLNLELFIKICGLLQIFASLGL